MPDSRFQRPLAAVVSLSIILSGLPGPAVAQLRTVIEAPALGALPAPGVAGAGLLSAGESRPALPTISLAPLSTVAPLWRLAPPSASVAFPSARGAAPLAAVRVLAASLASPSERGPRAEGSALRRFFEGRGLQANEPAPAGPAVEASEDVGPTGLAAPGDPPLTAKEAKRIDGYIREKLGQKQFQAASKKTVEALKKALLEKAPAQAGPILKAIEAGEVRFNLVYHQEYEAGFPRDLGRPVFERTYKERGILQVNVPIILLNQLGTGPVLVQALARPLLIELAGLTLSQARSTLASMNGFLTRGQALSDLDAHLIDRASWDGDVAYLEALALRDAGPSGAKAKSMLGSMSAAVLKQGRRVYAADARHQTLDAGTINDLELFNPTFGLFSSIDKTATAAGSKRLEWLLQHPLLDAPEIARRQAAVAEIQADAALRAALDKAYKSLGPAMNEGFLNGFFKRSEMFGLMFDVVVGNIFGAIPVLLYASTGNLHMVLTLLPQMAMMTLMLLGRTLWPRRSALRSYGAVLKSAGELAEALAGAKSDALRDLGRELGAVNDPARLKGLARGLARVLPVALAAPLDILYGHSAKTLPLLAKAFDRRRDDVAKVFGALAELDVFHSLAQTALESPGRYVMPQLREGPPSLSIEEGHHPRLVRRESIANGIALRGGPRGAAAGPNFLVMTGANMGGKSTYLKMVALSVLLAQIGSPVPAQAMAWTPMEIATNIDLRDSLDRGESFYDVETDRILAILKRAEKPEPLLVVMDEILQGTNPQDRLAAERAIVRYLAKTGQLFLLATHDLEMTKLGGELPGVANAHVEEKIEGGRMTFSYKVEPGPATRRNAIPVLEMKGYPKEITDEARSAASYPGSPSSAGPSGPR